MVKITKPEFPIRSEHHDVIHGDIDQYVRQFTPSEHKDKNLINLYWFSLNAWAAIQSLVDTGAIDQSVVKTLYKSSEYQDFYTNKTYHGFLPIGIYTNDVDRYFNSNKPWFYENAVDREYNTENNKHINRKRLCSRSDIDICLMGPCYTDFFIASDGSYAIEPVIVDLSNNDCLVGLIYIWYNK